jgi:hypothetical protein
LSSLMVEVEVEIFWTDLVVGFGDENHQHE